MFVLSYAPSVLFHALYIARALLRLPSLPSLFCKFLPFSYSLLLSIRSSSLLIINSTQYIDLGARGYC